MNYMTTKEASILWNISERRIRQLLTDGRIVGAIKVGTTWNIPQDSVKPEDKRLKPESPKFIIDLPNNYFDEIDRKKKLVDSKRPLAKETLKSLRESNILDWTYNSNAIEGNTLTLRETKVVLEGITIGGKSMKEHLEITNHREAIYFLEDLIKNKELMNEWNIKNIHRLILKEIDNDNAGIYRTENVTISGATHIPPTHYKVKEEMERLIILYNSWSNYHPIVRSALLHGEFVKIHPFIDGNGRTSRLLMNFEVMKKGYLPIIIKAESRLSYYDALDKASVKGDYTDFVKLIAELENNMLDKYLEIL